MDERRSAIKHYAGDSSDEEIPCARAGEAMLEPLAEPSDEPATYDDASTLAADTPLIAILNHDDELARNVAEAFEAEGWRSTFGRVPTGMEDLAEALRFIQETQPDVVVFDLVQPFPAQVETLRAIRRERAGRERPFVLITTNKLALAKEGVSRAVEIREPEDLAELTLAVRRAMSSGH